MEGCRSTKGMPDGKWSTRRGLIEREGEFQSSLLRGHQSPVRYTGGGEFLQQSFFEKALSRGGGKDILGNEFGKKHALEGNHILMG